MRRAGDHLRPTKGIVLVHEKGGGPSQANQRHCVGSWEGRGTISGQPKALRYFMRRAGDHLRPTKGIVLLHEKGGGPSQANQRHCVASWEGWGTISGQPKALCYFMRRAGDHLRPTKGIVLLHEKGGGPSQANQRHCVTSWIGRGPSQANQRHCVASWEGRGTISGQPKALCCFMRRAGDHLRPTKGIVLLHE